MTHLLSTISLSFFTIIPHLWDLPFQPQCLLQLHISPPFPTMHSLTPIFKLRGNYDKHMLRIKPLTCLLTSCKFSHSSIPFHELYGIISSRTNTSTSKNFMHRWIVGIVIKMMLRILQGLMDCLPSNVA